MKKLIFVLATLIVISASAFAAVDCNMVGLCKINVPIGGTDCSQRECPAVFGFSDTASDVVNLAIVLSNGLRCDMAVQRLDAQVTCSDQPGEDGTYFCGAVLTFMQDPPAGTEYSLAAFFAGCEENGRCGGFTAGNPMPDCGVTDQELFLKFAPEVLKLVPKE